MLLVLKFRAVSGKTFKKTSINHVHAPAERLPFVFALRVDIIEILLGHSYGLNAFLLVAVVVLEACVFDRVTLVEVIQDWSAFIKVVFAADILTALLKTNTSGLATILVTTPFECLDTFFWSLWACERAVH